MSNSDRRTILRITRTVRRAFGAVALSVICLVVVELLVVLSGTMARPPLKGLENQIVDLAFQARAKNQFHTHVSPEDVVIVDIDDASILHLGRPQLWPRAYDARVIAHVTAGQPKAIGIDFLYTEPDSFPSVYANLLEEKGYSEAGRIMDALSTDNELSNQIASAGNVYLSFFDDNDRKGEALNYETLPYLSVIPGGEGPQPWVPKLSYPVLPVQQFCEAASAVGSINMPTMQDGTVRYYNVLQEVPVDADQPYYTANFPFFMTVDALGIADSAISVEPTKIVLGDQGYIPLEDGGFRINWLGNADSIRYISFYKLLDGRVPPEFFTNKYVFFGTSASGMQDLKTIPSEMEKMPGVEVHAVAFLNMINQAFLHDASELDMLPLFALISLLLVSLFLAIRPLLGFVVAFGLVFAEMFLFILWFMPKYGTIFPIVTLMILTFFTYLGSSLFIYFIREKKNRRLKNAFGTYVSPDIVDKIIRDSSMLHLGGDRKELTVLFSDIRGFTSYSEKLDPQQVVAVLNDYLSRMSNIIFRHKGTIDKFIGDAIMAIFGAPVAQKDHADRACRVAIDMMNDIAFFNKEQLEKGQPPFRIGIGLNTGEMTVGNIGSERRFDYTVIGDSVNLGSRLEGLTKFFGVNILVSEKTRNACTTGDFLFREMAAVKVKGKEKSVNVYQLLGTKELMPVYGEWLETWKQALDHYRAQEFAMAIEFFSKCQEFFPDDLSTKGYIEECRNCIINPGRFNLVLTIDRK